MSWTLGLLFSESPKRWMEKISVDDQFESDHSNQRVVGLVLEEVGSHDILEGIFRSNVTTVDSLVIVKQSVHKSQLFLLVISVLEQIMNPVSLLFFFSLSLTPPQRIVRISLVSAVLALVITQGIVRISVLLNQSFVPSVVPSLMTKDTVVCRLLKQKRF
jgi:hypothetical protein